MLAAGVFPLPNVKLTWGNFDLFADKMTAEVNPHSECYEVTTAHRQGCYQGCYQGCLQVTIHKVLEHQQLPSETTFGCEIEIPGTDYFVRYILNGFNHHSLFYCLNMLPSPGRRPSMTSTRRGRCGGGGAWGGT